MLLVMVVYSLITDVQVIHGAGGAWRVDTYFVKYDIYGVVQVIWSHVHQGELYILLLYQSY